VLPQRRYVGILVFTCLAASHALAADVPEHVAGRLLLAPAESADPALIERTLLLHGAAVRRHLPALGMHVVDVPEASSEAILQSLRQTGLFQYVERDHYAHTGSASETPNDPSYLSQWYLQKIAGPTAWTLNTGSPSVVVAVIDSGVYAHHPDLETKIVAGWSFVASNGDTSDVYGHGTAVAGTLGAATNNGIGVAGVSWGSLIMPLVVVDSNNYAAYSDIAAAIQYAADRGVRIMNISVGGTDSSSALQSAVDYAWNKGALIFASAMNASTSAPYYPAACKHVVAVSASDNNDKLAAFSNFGNWITLAAPGTNILTTMNGGGYGYWNGTSFSSPIAAGVAALILAANPKLTNQELLGVLTATADDIGAPGFDSSFGWGRVNAARALAAVAPLPVTQPHKPRQPGLEPTAFPHKP